MRMRNTTPWEATKMDKDMYDSIFMAIKEYIDDHPHDEISVEEIHDKHGFEPKDIKTVLYYHLFVGELKCETYKKEGSMQTFMKLYNVSFEPVKCATKDAHGNHCPEYPTKQFNGVRLCDQCFRNAKIQYGKEHNRKG